MTEESKWAPEYCLSGCPVEPQQDSRDSTSPNSSITQDSPPTIELNSDQLLQFPTEEETVSLPGGATGSENAGYKEAQDDEEYDEFGFVLPQDGLTEAVLEYAASFKPKALRREARWQKFKIADPRFSNRRKLKFLVRKGVPDSLRCEVWTWCLGSRHLRDRYPGHYHEYVKTDIARGVADQIELDIRRTFPNNKAFRATNGVERIRRVLHAFAAYNPNVNYCQSMNFIAAMLLLFMEEDLAFWSVVRLLDTQDSRRMSVGGYYLPGMLCLRRDLKVLESLVAQRLPRSYRILRKFQVEMEWICAEWFLCFFATSLPIRTTLRVWDTLMLEGDKVLFRIALAIFKTHEEALTRLSSFESLMKYSKGMARGMVHHNELVKAAFYGMGTFSRSELLHMRQEAVGQLRIGQKHPDPRIGFQAVVPLAGDQSDIEPW